MVKKMKTSTHKNLRESSVIKVFYREAKDLKKNKDYWLLVKRIFGTNYGKAKVYKIVRKSYSHNGLWDKQFANY